MIGIGKISGLSSRNIQQQRRYSTSRKVNLNPSFYLKFVKSKLEGTKEDEVKC
jgi:hypothetical protein